MADDGQEDVFAIANNSPSTTNTSSSSSSSSLASDMTVEQQTTTAEGDDTVKLMLIFCCVAGGVFSIIYFMFWRRGRHNERMEIERERRQQQQNGNGDENESVKTEDMDDDDLEDLEGSGHLSVSSSRRRRSRRSQSRSQPIDDTNNNNSGHHRGGYSDATWTPNRERQPGDPHYDRSLIGGTMSLGLLLWVGSSIVLGVSLNNSSDFNGASTSDFQSLGPTACRIVNASSYAYFDNEVSTQRTVCIEQWEYFVKVVDNDGHDESSSTSSSVTTFIAAPITVPTCSVKCESCIRSGPNHFAGVDSRKQGEQISNSDEEPTLVECWAPTIPVDDLSDFYPCGKQRFMMDDDGNGDVETSNDGTCYLLADPVPYLKEEQFSSQIGVIVACCGYVFGGLLVAMASFWIIRNRQIRKKELEEYEQEQVEQQTQQQTTEDNNNDDDDNSVCQRSSPEIENGEVRSGEGEGNGNNQSTSEDVNVDRSNTETTNDQSEQQQQAQSNAAESNQPDTEGPANDRSKSEQQQEKEKYMNEDADASSKSEER